MAMFAVALIFPENVSKKIDTVREQFGTESVRAIIPHITLKFPFSPRVETDVICDKLQSIALQTRRFKISLGGFRFFKEPNVAYIYLEDQRPVFDLHQSIIRSLDGLVDGRGQYELNNYVPHITVGDDIPEDTLDSFKLKITDYYFQEETVVDSFVLFANDGTGWQISKVFHLTGI
jgi:2'-5' RNA ligase